MTTIYLVRHGETEWNKINKIQGKSNTELSETGKKQAKLIGDSLKDKQVNIIYTSDLKRASMTANIISSILNISIVEMTAYQEIGLGPWEGLTLDEIKKLYKEQYKAYREDPVNFFLEGAETLDAVGDRAYRGIIDIVDKHRDSNIIIVSHGTAIKAAIMKILDIDLSRYNKFKIDNGSICTITFDNNFYGGVVISGLNETSHLDNIR